MCYYLKRISSRHCFEQHYTSAVHLDMLTYTHLDSWRNTMQKLTRRRLIRQASIGVGAVGVLTATTISTKTKYTGKASAAANKSVLAAGEALVVYVTDAEAGTLTVLRGEKATTVNDVALVQHILSL